MQYCIGRLSRRTQLRSTVFDRIIDIRAVDLLQILILFLDGERDSMCANFAGFQVRTQRDVLVINLRIIALDHGKARHRFAEDRLDLPAFPILHFPIRLGDFSHRIMSKRRGNQVFIYAWHMLLGHFGQDAGECPVNIPVGTRLPERIDRRVKRMHERVHVGRGEIHLLVPGCRRENDIGIHRCRRHPEVKRYKQIQLAFHLIAPNDFFRLLLIVRVG
ncbi:hypothetical protein D3C81_821270 [compost metagenome]